MPANVSTMMYVGQTPWHKLGVKLASPPTCADAIKAAGLDWKVDLQQLRLPDGRDVERWATVRGDNGAVLGTVGKGFRVLQNVDAFGELFDPFVKAGAATLETAGVLGAGERVWILAKLANGTHEIVKGDPIESYVMLGHGHDGSLAIHYGLTPIRVVCQNTLSAAISDKGSALFRVRHTKGAAAALADVAATVAGVQAQFGAAAEVFRALAAMPVQSAAQLRAYIDAVFPPQGKPKAKAAQADDFASLLSKPVSSDRSGERMSYSKGPLPGQVTDADRSRLHDEITALFEGGRGNTLPGVRGTAWGAYNAVTEYLTWERGRSADNRLGNVWFGDVGTRAAKAARDTFLGGLPG